jgi:outer membrane protein OmpA-like peptidoglycan-associated protein
MDESSSTEHLSSSLTDLMTSLMVIFILLLLVFISGSASKDLAVRQVLLKKLEHELTGYGNDNIRPDPKDPTAILIIVPNKLMNFELGKADLRAEGAEFLRDHIPQLAEIVCAPEFHDSVDSIVVEGYSDETGFRGSSKEESESRNLELSQNRSMKVVSKALDFLVGQPVERACFLNKLSASGRGQQDQQDNPENSRRVIFKLRVKAKDTAQIVRGVK